MGIATQYEGGLKFDGDQMYITTSGGTTLLTLGNTGNATFAGTISSGAITSTGQITGTELEGTSLDINGSADISGNITGVDNLYADKVYINSLQTLATSSNFLYIDPNASFGSGIYINNAVRVDGGLLGSYNEDLQLRTGTTTRLTLSNSDGSATFAGKVRANNWFQGADGTNTLYANSTAGVLIQTPGSTANNNDSKIYFRNHGTTVKHTFDTNSGDATFANNVYAQKGVFSDGMTVTGDMSSFETTLTNNEDWQNSPISILERGNVQGTETADKYSPNLNFHWGGVVSKSLWMGYNGHLNWGEYSSTGIPASDGTFKTGTLYAGAESITATKVGQWNTAYTDRNKWDGGSTGLTASTGRASLGLGTAATAAATAFATSGHNHAGVYALEYELMQSDNSDRDMHVWRKNHAMLSDDSGISTYIIVQTNVPQDNYSMGGFTLVYQDHYSSSSEGGEIKIYGYWNPESNSGFIGFRYECSNPYHTPTIEVCRNSSSGDTAFFISGEGGSYTQLIAKDLWLGYSASSATSQWGDSWTITQADAKDGYTNFDTLNRNDFSAITTNGSTPSLTGGVTAAEVRTLIGAGTGNGSSDLVIGTTATTAMAGNTAFASTAQGTKADNAAPKDYESIANLGSPDAISGTWTNGNTTDWGTPRIGSSTAKFTDGTGYIQFDIPSGMKTAYLSQLTWSSGGYFHIYGIQSDGGAVLLRVVNSKNSVENTNEGNPNQHDGSTTVFAGTGLDNYSAIRIKNQSGRLHLTGLGFTSSTVQGAEGMGLVHPNQLSTALSYNSLINLPTLGTAAATASTDYATAAQGTKADSALQSLPSHNHNDIYYQESEIRLALARINGWEAGYGSGTASNIKWNLTEEALELKHDTDTSIGAVYKAVYMESGETKRFSVMIRGSSSSANGMYLRLYQHDGDLPNGKTHVSNDAQGTFVQEDDRGDTGWYENGTVSDSWTTFERDYKAPVSGYVSLVVLNWTGVGLESLFIKTPDIQTRYAKVESGSIGISQLAVSDGTTGQVLTTNGSGTLSFSTVASSSDTNYYLDGITRTDSTNTLVFSVSGATNQSFTFGANAFNSTTIPAAEAYTAHEDTSTLSGVYGDTANGTKIDTITVDANGHITAIATGATGNLTGFFVEDGDGTEVQINNANEWKFVEGTGININWTDTNQGIDSDPYDLTFSLKDNSVSATQLNVSGNGTAGQVLASDGDGTFSWVADANTDTVYTHPTSAGNKHIPTGGAAGQFLKYSSSGTATWATPSYTTNTNTQLSQEEVLGMLTAGANITITTDGEISATDTDTVYTHPTSAGNKHIPTGGAAGQFLKYSASGTATWATPSYTTNTNTTYSAGSGLDLTGTTFSVEPDLRDGITHVGKDSNNYIQFDSTNGRIDFYAGGVFVARMESDGDLHMKGDVIAFSDIF